MFQVQVWHRLCLSSQGGFYSPILHIPLTSQISLFIVLLCSGLSPARTWQPFSLQSAHINNKITSCSLLLWLAIILQLKSCRELEAKWMLWRMLMCVEWEHCLPLAKRATASCFEHFFFKEAFSCCHKRSSSSWWKSLIWIWQQGNRLFSRYIIGLLLKMVAEAEFCAHWWISNTKLTLMCTGQTSLPNLSYGLH